MIAVCVLLCDRKFSSSMVAIPRVCKIKGDDVRIYLNIETANLKALRQTYAKLFAFLDKNAAGRYDVDAWSWSSSWWQPPRFDQDQRRLTPIVMARNMALNYAVSHPDCTHVLFIDSDVRPHPDGLQKLLEMDRPLVGGVVPGRGPHSNMLYLFGNDVKRLPNGWIQVHHGTCGYMLIRRDLFSVIRFRYGPAGHGPTPMTDLSEDPAFCFDAREFMGVQRMYIHPDVQAEHWDDPEHPLTETAVAQF